MRKILRDRRKNRRDRVRDKKRKTRKKSRKQLTKKRSLRRQQLQEQILIKEIKNPPVTKQTSLRKLIQISWKLYAPPSFPSSRRWSLAQLKNSKISQWILCALSRSFRPLRMGTVPPY